jgi:membrane protease YdiL (CAAX protease family)
LRSEEQNKEHSNQHANSSASAVLFVAYLLLLNTTWTVWVLFGYPWLRTLGEQTLAYALINLTVRGLVWVLPVLLYLRYLDRVDPFAYLKLREHWLRGILIGLGVSALILLRYLVQYGWPRLHPGVLTWNSVLGTSILIGFFEEIPYRGFVFQKLCDWMSRKAAIAISSLLFVAIHLPGWISLHLFTVPILIFVFGFGVLMAILFVYTKSLWAPIVSHSLNDFLSAVLFHQ